MNIERNETFPDFLKVSRKTIVPDSFSREQDLLGKRNVENFSPPFSFWENRKRNFSFDVTEYIPVNRFHGLFRPVLVGLGLPKSLY